MKQFNIPAQLNGEQLKQELAADSVYVLNDKLCIVSDKSIAAIDLIIKNHLPFDAATAKAALLARLGITADEAKLLLS
jgi:hypothetical protein